MISGEKVISLNNLNKLLIPKPGKENSDPGNYWSISLTSCLCKTSERIVNNRLVWYLEFDKLNLTMWLSQKHDYSGPPDSLGKLYKGSIYIKKKITVVTYSLTWKKLTKLSENIRFLRDLHDFGLKDTLPGFIKNFLSNKTFQVSIGSTLSNQKTQEKRVSHRSILKVTLFSIEINSITEELDNVSMDLCM